MADTHPPLLISNFWGFTTTQWESVFTEVSLYPDMIIFFLNASLHSPPHTIEHYRQLIHYHWVPFLFSFPFSVSHPLTPPSHRPPPPLSRAGVSQCENLIMFCYWTCKLNWTESYSPGLSRRACIVFLCEGGRTSVCALFVCVCAQIPVCVIGGE